MLIPSINPQFSAENIIRPGENIFTEDPPTALAEVLPG